MKPQIPAISSATSAFLNGPLLLFSCRLSETKPGDNATTVSKLKANVPNYSVGGKEHNFTQQTCPMLDAAKLTRRLPAPPCWEVQLTTGKRGCWGLGWYTNHTEAW